MKKNFLVVLIFSLISLISFSANEVSKEPIYIGQTFVISSMTPTSGGNPWSITTHGISETVFMLNEKGELNSRFIETIEKTDELNWNVTMKKDVKFSNGDLVKAEDLVNCMNIIMEKNPLSNATAGKVKFETTGEYSFKLATERPIQNLKSLFTEWSNIVFKDLGNENYVFTGPFMVGNLDPNVELKLVPNPFYPNSEKRGEVVIKKFNDIASMKLAYESGELDMAFGITPEISEMLSKEGYTVKTIEAGYQYFGLLNLSREPFSDYEVRKAINLALDRNDYIKVLRGGNIATGVFANYYAFAGDVKVEYDIEKANEILEKDGWILGKDGIREKNNKKLTINIVTYPSRPDLSTIMQIMVSQLNKIGVSVKTDLVDNIDTHAQTNNFDMLLYAQHSAPTGYPLFFLSQFFRTNGPKNHSKYSSEEYDNIIDKIGTIESEDEVIKLAKEAQRVIYKDLPALYLVDPQWHIALSKRLENYKPYGGDYYIVNPELFNN